MASKEKILRKGKGYKMTKVIVSGNYVVYHSGKQYIFAKKSEANQMVEAYRKVRRITKK